MSLLQTQANNTTFNFGLQIYQFCIGLDLGLGVSHRSCAVRSSLQKAQCTQIDAIDVEAHLPPESTKFDCGRDRAISRIISVWKSGNIAVEKM